MTTRCSVPLGKLALKKCSCEELPGGRLSGVLLAGRAGETDAEPAMLAQLASDLFSGLLLWPGQTAVPCLNTSENEKLLLIYLD